MTDETVVSTTAIERLERIGGPDFLRQMIELYLQHGPERIRALDEGVLAGDAGQIERAAHSLKSSAGNLGAERLQQAALTLELLGAAGTVDAGAAADVKREYEASERALRALLQEIET